MEEFTLVCIEIGYLVQQHGCEKVLLDFSNAKLDFAADELINLLDLYAEYHIPLGTRSAIVLGSSNTKHAFSKFLHTAKEFGYGFELLVGDKQRDDWLSPSNN